jgi:hypothetical protein
MVFPADLDLDIRIDIARRATAAYLGRPLLGDESPGPIS